MSDLKDAGKDTGQGSLQIASGFGKVVRGTVKGVGVVAKAPTKKNTWATIGVLATVGHVCGVADKNAEEGKESGVLKLIFVDSTVEGAKEVFENTRNGTPDVIDSIGNTIEGTVDNAEKAVEFVSDLKLAA